VPNFYRPYLSARPVWLAWASGCRRYAVGGFGLGGHFSGLLTQATWARRRYLAADSVTRDVIGYVGPWAPLVAIMTRWLIKAAWRRCEQGADASDHSQSVVILGLDQPHSAPDQEIPGITTGGIPAAWLPPRTKRGRLVILRR